MSAKKSSPAITKGEGGLVSSERIYATADGKIVSGDDPAAAVLVAAAGVPIPEKIAARYGLKPETKAAEKDEPAEKAEKVEPLDVGGDEPEPEPKGKGR